MVFPFFCLPPCSTRSMFCTLFLISLCAVLHIWMFQRILNFVDDVTVMMSASKRARRLTPLKSNIKYILLWDKLYLFINKNGYSIFPSLNCSVKDCVVTTERNRVGDISKFDSVVFSDKFLTSEERPKRRSPSQIFVFATYEAPQTHPACELHNDHFFNWTLTYRLDSDVMWNYFVVRNRSNVVVAPKVDVTWKLSRRRQLRPEVRSILKKKTKAAAWVVSHCNAKSYRDLYLSKLQRHLQHFALHIDVFGECSKLKCPNDKCDEMLAQNYRFYMAFENTINKDYVTEKVMNGYRNYAVPVVYGGANYSRFLPPGSYINAREMHPYNLASAIYEATRKLSVFESYFNWTNVYSIEDIGTQGDHPLCNLCAALHEERAKHAPAKKNFRVWWNTLDGMRWCLSDDYWNENAQMEFDEALDSLY